MRGMEQNNLVDKVMILYSRKSARGSNGQGAPNSNERRGAYRANLSSSACETVSGSTCNFDVDNLL